MKTEEVICTLTLPPSPRSGEALSVTAANRNCQSQTSLTLTHEYDSPPDPAAPLSSQPSRTQPQM